MISKSNKRGVILIALLALIIIYTPRILMSLKQDEDFVTRTYKKPEKKDSLEVLDKKTNYSSINKYTNSPSKRELKYKAPPSRFNPNHYKYQDWLYLGLSEKQTDVIIKFLKSGINSNEDLKKIYVLPDEVYQLIKDSTFYTELKNSNQNKKVDSPILVEKVFLEINTSSQNDLKKIKGIGDFFASQIITRRDQLGGFVTKEQLLEVWKLDSIVYQKIQGFVFIDTLSIKKIDLNSASKDDFQKHPYLRWNQANSIVQIRKQKGRFDAINDILESKLISDSLYHKIKPYLKLD